MSGTGAGHVPPRHEGPAHSTPAQDGFADDGPASDHPEQDPSGHSPTPVDHPEQDPLGHARRASDHPGQNPPTQDPPGQDQPLQDPPGQDQPLQDPPGQDQPLQDHPALAGLLGHWHGSTRLAAGPWGPERTVDAEVTYRRVAGGFAVVQSYRHVEADGSHFEGHGMFTVDPDHQDVLWYYVDSAGPAPDAPARCLWHDGVLRVERHGSAGWTRHTLRADGDVLTHITELRTQTGGAAGEGGLGENGLGEGVGANGTGAAYNPFMTSLFSRS